MINPPDRLLHERPSPFVKGGCKLIIYDLDGTLVDSAPDIAAAVNGMRRELNHAEKPLDIIKQWVGNGSAMLMRRSLADVLGCTPETVPAQPFQQAHELFFKHYRLSNGQHTSLFPGVLETLKHFKQAGVQQAICTNKPGEFTHPLLKQLSLSQFFYCVVSGDTLMTKKPDPAPLLFCAEQCDVAASQCLMVGDSMTDVKAAEAAGMRVICVDYGYNRGDNLSQHCHTVSNFEGLLLLE